MAYIKQKNSNIIVCQDGGIPIQGTTSELQNHSAVLSGFHEVINESLPSEIKEKLIYSEPE